MCRDAPVYWIVSCKNTNGTVKYIVVTAECEDIARELVTKAFPLWLIVDVDFYEMYATDIDSRDIVDVLHQYGD